MIRSEPAVIISGLTGLVTASIALALAFGLDVSDEQRNAILGVIGPAVGVVLLVGGLIRQFVVAPDTHQQEVAEAASDTRRQLMGRYGSTV
jgi:hypothetical protein